MDYGQIARYKHFGRILRQDFRILSPSPWGTGCALKPCNPEDPREKSGLSSSQDRHPTSYSFHKYYQGSCPTPSWNPHSLYIYRLAHPSWYSHHITRLRRHKCPVCVHNLLWARLRASPSPGNANLSLARGSMAGPRSGRQFLDPSR